MAYKKNYNKDEYAKEKAQEVKNLVNKIEDGVREFMTSDKFKDYLNVMSKFHKYSFSNSLLIAFQRPDSTVVAGYTTWKKLGRQVNKGSKSIKILAPAPYKTKVETEIVNPITGKKEKTEQELTKMAFKTVSVFDISDTNGKELPKLCEELKGEAKHLDIVKEVTKELTGIEVVYENIKGGAKGYFAPLKNKIAIKNGLSKLHEEKTIIHELSHALLHSNMKADGITRSAAETQAEATAYVVCQKFGLDTGNYSFPYLTSWASNAELVDLKESLKVIQQTSMLIIDKIEEKLKVLEIDKEVNNGKAEPLKEKEIEIIESNYPYLYKGDVMNLEKADEQFREINAEMKELKYIKDEDYSVTFKIRDEKGSEREVLKAFEFGYEKGGLKEFFKDNFSQENYVSLFGNSEEKGIDNLILDAEKSLNKSGCKVEKVEKEVVR